MFVLIKYTVNQEVVTDFRENVLEQLLRSIILFKLLFANLCVLYILCSSLQAEAWLRIVYVAECGLCFFRVHNNERFDVAEAAVVSP